MNDDDLSDLLGRVALGDRPAFQTLYDRTSAKLFGVCLRILKDSGEAEDVLQEVFVKVWHGARSFSARGFSPLSWLVAIARNQAIDRLRARRPGLCPMDEAAETADDAPSPERLAMAADDGQMIGRCLDELATPRAEAVRLAYVDGYSYQELAERFGIPLNTIRTWLRRSLLSLRECLER